MKNKLYNQISYLGNFVRLDLEWIFKKEGKFSFGRNFNFINSQIYFSQTVIIFLDSLNSITHNSLYSLGKLESSFHFTVNAMWRQDWIKNDWKTTKLLGCLDVVSCVMFPYFVVNKERWKGATAGRLAGVKQQNWNLSLMFLNEIAFLCSTCGSG